MRALLCLLVAGATSAGAPASFTALTEHLKVFQFLREKSLHVVVSFSFINEQLAYGFANAALGPDFFVVKLVDGAYSLAGGDPPAPQEPKVPAQPRWQLVETVVVEDALVVWVSRDLERHPVADMKADANAMIYNYSVPREGDEELQWERGNATVPFTPDPDGAPADEDAPKLNAPTSL